MDAQTYLKLHPELHKVLLGKDFVFYQDCDSAHLSKEVTTWMYRNAMDTVIAPAASPDLSILETWIKELR
jgi:hypothetical protein